MARLRFRGTVCILPIANPGPRDILIKRGKNEYDRALTRHRDPKSHDRR
jgi:hypothetical protein